MADATRRINLYINDIEVENSVKAISTEFQKQNAILRNMNRGAQDYEQQLRRVASLKKVIDEHNNSLKTTQISWKSIMSTVGQFATGAVLGGAVQSMVMGVANLLPIAAESAATLSDELTDIEKNANMSAQEVKKLNAELKTLDTRTTMSERRKLAVVGGKMGIQGVDELKSFVAAADKILVSLGEDLGGVDSIKALAKLTEIFGAKDAFGTEQSLLKIGSAINTLGSTSVANEKYISEWSSRFGGIAKTANITIPQILGLASANDILGKSEELSASAIAKLLVDMGQEKGLAKYAKVAKMEMKAFADLMKKDANEAMLRVLEGAKSTKGGLGALAETLEKLGVTGVEQAQVLPALAQNIDLVRAEQEKANKAFTEGTSILDEFNKKNNNFAARYEKMKNGLNEVTSALVQRMQPAMENMVRVVSKWVGIDAASQIEKERDKVFALSVELSQANISEQKRLEILNELKTISPSIIDELDKEAFSVQKLWENIDKYNESANKRLEIEKNNEEQMLIGQKGVEAQKMMAEARTGIQKNMARLMAGLADKDREAATKLISDKNLSLTQQYEKIVRKFLMKSKNKVLIDTELIEQFNYANRLITWWEKEAKRVADSTSKLKKQVEDLRTPEQKKADADKEAADKKATEDQAAADKEAASQAAKDAAKAAYEAGLEKLRRKQDLAEIEFRLQGANEQAMTNLQIKHAKERFAYYSRFSKARTIEAQRELLTVKELIEKNMPSFEKSNERMSKEQVLEVATATEENLTEITKKHIKQRIELYEQWNMVQLAADERKKLKEFEADELKTEADRVERRWALRKQYTLRGMADVLAYEKYQLQKKFETDMELFGEQSEERKKLYEEYLKQLNALDEQYRDKDVLGFSEEDWTDFESKLGKVIGIGQQVAAFWEQGIALSNAAIRKEIAQSNAAADKKKETLGQELNAKLISQRRYDTQMKRIERERAEREAELNRKQAEREKALSLFRIAIYTAEAIVAAKGNFLKIAFAVAMGLAQAAVVQAQDIPAYAAGGWVNGDSVIRAGEEGREWVASNKLVQNPATAPVIAYLDALQSGRRYTPATAVPRPQTAAVSTPTGASTFVGASSIGAGMVQSAEAAALVNEIRAMRLAFEKNEVRAKIAPYELTRFDDDTAALKNLSKF